MTQPRTVEVDQFLAHPPARVWLALTEPALLARWLMPGDLKPVVGHQFTFDTGARGPTHCEILAVEPERSLTMSWRNGSLDTTVTWSLQPEGRGTRLIIIHEGFDSTKPEQRSAHQAMSIGWATTLIRRLSDVLAHATDARLGQPSSRQQVSPPSTALDTSVDRR